MVSTSTHKVQHMVSISTQGEHINTQSTTQQCTLQTGQLRFGPYTILAWTAQSVNCHIALKAMFYLLTNTQFSFGTGFNPVKCSHKLDTHKFTT